MPSTAVRRSASWLVAPLTVTTKLAVLVLPPRSVAVHVLEVSPIANRLPTAGVQTRLGAGARSSVAVTPYGTVAPDEAVACTVMLATTSIVGAIVPYGVRSQTSPVPSPSASAWAGLAVSGQLSVALATVSPSRSLSQTSPMPSWSASVWAGLAVLGQLSVVLATVSPS